MPGQIITEDQNHTGGQHANAVHAIPNTIGQPQLIFVQHFDGVSIDGNITGR